ncbi:MAG: XRE family transcriptional regulator [Gammaproteobacteria bacterium]|nr:XRE family transcriptional regulator [Gammaproteobacteria bacterium]
MTKTVVIKNEEVLWEEGSSNVFADLGMSDAKEKFAKAQLALKINKIIKDRKLKQKMAAQLLGIDQAKISLLSNGRLSAFSIGRLIKFLNLLEQDVEVRIKTTKNTSHVGSFRVVAN